VITSETPAPVRDKIPEPFFACFAADFDRQFIYFDGSGWLGKVRIYLTTHSLWTLTAYRFGRSLKTRPIPVLNPVLWVGYRILEFVARATTGIILDIDARLAPGIFIGHFGALAHRQHLRLSLHCRSPCCQSACNG
jgi:hypothetical protein